MALLTDKISIRNNSIKKRLLLLVSLFFTLACAFAQHTSKQCFLCQKGQLHHHHETPYKDFTFKSELPFLTGIVGLSTTSLLLKTPEPLSIEAINLLDKSQVNSFDRYATSQHSESARKLSDFFLTGVLVLPAVFLSNHNTRQDLLPLAALTAEVALINLSLTIISKKLVGRTRPLVYNDNFSIEEKTTENARASFFSGHTSHTASLSFLIAKVINDYHPDAKRGIKVGLWAFAASVPALTGYLRVKAGKHFPTDTITGFVAGGLVGILIPHFHKKKKVDLAKKVNMNMSVGLGAATFSMTF